MSSKVSTLCRGGVQPFSHCTSGITALYSYTCVGVGRSQKVGGGAEIDFGEGVSRPPILHKYIHLLAISLLPLLYRDAKMLVRIVASVSLQQEILSAT